MSEPTQNSSEAQPGDDAAASTPQEQPAPTAEQPTAEQPPVDQQPAAAEPAAAAQPTVAQPAAAQPTAPYPPTATAVADRPKRTTNPALVVGALVVGAVLGGASGAGVAAWAVSQNAGVQSTASSINPKNITVNNTDDVNAVTAIAEKAGPSVVTINVTAGQEGGTGSGVILSADGYVLTNTHVVTLDGESSKGKVEVTTADGKLYKATVVGTDPTVDLAVIKLTDASGLQPIEFGDSGKLNVGDRVVAIGAPLGLSNTVTDGIVSALNRSIQIASSAVPDGGSGGDSATPDPNGQSPFNFWNFGDGGGSGGNGNDGGNGGSVPSSQSAEISLPVIQTDASINPGNSGGALLDGSGKLVGINCAIASTGSTDASSQSGSIGVGFAIPAALAQRISQEIIKTGHGSHGLLGASVTDATADTSSTVGAAIDSVTSSGAAAAAGLQKGDVVTQFNGIPITSSTDLTAQVRFLAPGSKAKLSYVRDGKATTVEVTLGTLTS